MTTHKRWSFVGLGIVLERLVQVLNERWDRWPQLFKQKRGVAWTVHG